MSSTAAIEKGPKEILPETLRLTDSGRKEIQKLTPAHLRRFIADYLEMHNELERLTEHGDDMLTAISPYGHLETSTRQLCETPNEALLRHAASRTAAMEREAAYTAELLAEASRQISDRDRELRANYSGHQTDRELMERIRVALVDHGLSSGTAETGFFVGSM